MITVDNLALTVYDIANFKDYEEFGRSVMREGFSHNLFVTEKIGIDE